MAADCLTWAPWGWTCLHYSLQHRMVRRCWDGFSTDTAAATAVWASAQHAFVHWIGSLLTVWEAKVGHLREGNNSKTDRVYCLVNTAAERVSGEKKKIKNRLFQYIPEFSEVHFSYRLCFLPQYQKRKKKKKSLYLASKFTLSLHTSLKFCLTV